MNLVDIGTVFIRNGKLVLNIKRKCGTGEPVPLIVIIDQME